MVSSSSHCASVSKTFWSKLRCGVSPDKTAAEVEQEGAPDLVHSLDLRLSKGLESADVFIVVKHSQLQCKVMPPGHCKALPWPNHSCFPLHVVHCKCCNTYGDEKEQQAVRPTDQAAPALATIVAISAVPHTWSSILLQASSRHIRSQSKPATNKAGGACWQGRRSRYCCSCNPCSKACSPQAAVIYHCYTGGWWLADTNSAIPHDQGRRLWSALPYVVAICCGSNCKLHAQGVR